MAKLCPVLAYSMHTLTQPMYTACVYMTTSLKYPITWDINPCLFPPKTVHVWLYIMISTPISLIIALTSYLDLQSHG